MYTLYSSLSTTPYVVSVQICWRKARSSSLLTLQLPTCFLEQYTVRVLDDTSRSSGLIYLFFSSASINGNVTEHLSVKNVLC